MPADISGNMITHIEDSDKLRRMVLAWNTSDTEFLEEYFKRGGKPYISFPSKFISTADHLSNATMLTGYISSSNQTTVISPLPLLCVRQHFVRDDRTIDKTAMEAYNKMLDMCLEHGLNIDTCDSSEMTLLNASIAYFSVFSQLLPEPAKGSWENSKVNYSSKLFDYSTAGILLNRGADPFRRTEDKYYTNVLNNAAEGACCAGDRLRYSCLKNPGLWNTGNSGNMFYADMLFRICSDAPDFASSPFQIHEQQNIVNRIIEGGFMLFTSNGQQDHADKFIFILENLLSKNIVSGKGLSAYKNKKSSRSRQVSSLYCFCRGARKAIDYISFIDNTGRVDHKYVESLYNAVKDYAYRILMLLQNYGADLNRKEPTGNLPTYALFSESSSYGYNVGFPKGFYAYLRDFETMLLLCGWDPAATDKRGNTLQDYYPNKLEGSKAMKAIKKVAKQIEAEKAAYSNFEEEFMR